MVRIRNKITGEVREVKDNELQNFGLGPGTNLSQPAATAQGGGGGLGFSGGGGGLDIKTIIGLSMLTNAKKNSDITTALGLLEGTSAQQATQQESMERGGALSTLGTDVTQLEQRRRMIGGSFKGPVRIPSFIGKSYDPDIAAFEGLRETVSFNLAGAIAGQTGRSLSDQEREDLREALPSIKDTEAAVMLKLNDLAKQIETRFIQAGFDPVTAKFQSSSILEELGIPTQGIGNQYPDSIQWEE